MEVKASNQITLMNTDLVDAAKTATNYLGFSSGGLVVGDLTGSTLGKNVLIDSDGVDIRSGNTVLASFESNKISLGVNDSDSRISLCNGNGDIYMGSFLNTTTNETSPALTLTSEGLLFRARDRNDLANSDIADLWIVEDSDTDDTHILLYVSDSSTLSTIMARTNSIAIRRYDSNAGSELACYSLYGDGIAEIRAKDHLYIDAPVHFYDSLYMQSASGVLVDVLSLSANGYSLYFGDTSEHTTIYGASVTIETEDPTYRTYIKSHLDVSTKIYVGSNDIEITGSNKVLWTGLWAMYDTQTATLSEAISAQVNGIVLVFCAWDANTQTLQQWNWNHVYIPKQDVVYNGTTGHTMALFAYGFGSIAYKYLYISDTTITGHANNASTGTTNGITYDNSRFVLRYVIGV